MLQAGDILLYQTDIVPVGIDQRQHIELTRDVAERFNSRYGETFTLPSGVYPEVGAKIMDLQDPEKKMSTTGGTEQGTVYLLDSADEIRRKFKVAVTDSGREVLHAPDKPGISNLIEIMTVSTGESIDGDPGALRRTGVRRVQERSCRVRDRAPRADPATIPRGPRRSGRASATARTRRREGARGVAADARRDVRADGLRPARLEADCGPQRRNLPSRQLSPLSDREPVDVERRVASAPEAAHGVSDGLAHALHLAVPTLVERELESGPVRPASQDADACRCGRAVVELDAVAEPGDDVG